jgi:hypothetical protein
MQQLVYQILIFSGEADRLGRGFGEETELAKPHYTQASHSSYKNRCHGSGHMCDIHEKSNHGVRASAAKLKKTASLAREPARTSNGRAKKRRALNFYPARVFELSRAKNLPLRLPRAL